jgi:hypothetical protein
MGVAASRQEAFWEACGFGHKERVKKFLECGPFSWPVIENFI